MTRLWIDIETGAGVKLGDGPITTAYKWRNVARLDRAGEFAFDMPASDPRAALVQAKRIARCYGQLTPGGAITEFGAGVIDRIQVVPGQDGSAQLSVAGGDLLRELTNRSVGFLSLTDGAGGPTLTALAQIMALMPGWALDPAGYLTTGFDDYAQLAGESVLSAFVRLAEHNGQHFRAGPGRTLRWLRGGLAPSGVRAVRSGDALALAGNPDACLIHALDEAQDSYDLITRIVGYGAGNANARLTLAQCSRTAPAGYTLDLAQSLLVNDAAEALYGRIERYLSWKEVGPISNSDTDLQSAANVLYDAMYAQLSRQSAPQKTYRLGVLGLDRALYPGETIHTIYHDWVDGYHAVAIDAELCILEATTEIDNSGMRTVALQVSTTDQWPTDTAELQAAELERGRFMEAHPQLTIAYSPVGPYTRRMDATHPATFTVRIGKEVTNLNYAILRFKTGPLVSSTASAAAGGGSTQTSGGGGGVSLTSSGGGSLSGTTGAELADHDHDETGTTTGKQNQDHSHNFSTVSHTHGVTIPDHTHSVTIPTHTHTLTYGLYQDSLYPVSVTISIDGTDRTAALGGPWAAGGGADSAELEITSYLESNLRSNHTLVFSCASGQDEVEVEADLLVSLQAIAMV